MLTGARILSGYSFQSAIAIAGVLVACCPGAVRQSPDCCCRALARAPSPECCCAGQEAVSDLYISSIEADTPDQFLGCRKHSIVGTRAKVIWKLLPGHFRQEKSCNDIVQGMRNSPGILATVLLAEVLYVAKILMAEIKVLLVGCCAAVGTRAKGKPLSGRYY